MFYNFYQSRVSLPMCLLITINAFKQSLRKFKLLVWNYDENRIQKTGQVVNFKCVPQSEQFSL